MLTFSPHYTIHLGDVYYVGRKDEVRENCLGVPPPSNAFTPCCWPLGSVGSFALNGNHEMYALGNGYFDVFLPALGTRPGVGVPPSGQRASFFCLENAFWRIIALDSGYNSIGIPVFEYLFSPSCKLRNEELDWIEHNVNPKADKRGLILLTHHQYCSSFDAEYPKIGQQLSGFIDRPVLWLWGHEHRMSVYGKYATNGGIEAYGRCIGHGGMPVGINPTFNSTRNRPLAVYDNRQYASPENITVGYNGFANLVFKDELVTISYHDLKNNLLLTEQWRMSGEGLTGTAALGNASPGLTVLGNGLTLATT
jgi:hypothetical protein